MTSMTSSKRPAAEEVEVCGPEGLTFFPPLLCASLQSCLKTITFFLM